MTDWIDYYEELKGRFSILWACVRPVVSLCVCLADALCKGCAAAAHLLHTHSFLIEVLSLSMHQLSSCRNTNPTQKAHYSWCILQRLSQIMSEPLHLNMLSGHNHVHDHNNTSPAQNFNHFQSMIKRILTALNVNLTSLQSADVFWLYKDSNYVALFFFTPRCVSPLLLYAILMNTSWTLVRLILTVHTATSHIEVYLLSDNKSMISRSDGRYEDMNENWCFAYWVMSTAVSYPGVFHYI